MMPLRDLPAARLPHQFNAALNAKKRLTWMHAPTEAGGGFGMQLFAIPSCGGC